MENDVELSTFKHDEPDILQIERAKDEEPELMVSNLTGSAFGD